MKSKKPRTYSKPRKLAALAVLAILMATCLAAISHAADAPIVSVQRIAIAAQVGAQWQRDTNLDGGFESKPAVRLIGSYRLYGPESGLARGSVALVAPAELSLTSEHQARFGLFLSIILFDGLDKPVAP